MLNSFSPSDWIAIATCIISVIISLILYQRIRRKKIFFLQTDHFQMNNVDFSKYPDLEMIYRNENLTGYLYFISGTIFMIGDEDIDEDDIKHPICLIITNNNSHWKNCEITDKTNLLNCEKEFDQNKLKFKTKEIKNNDFIKFNAYYNGSKLGAKFHHRIMNVNHHIEVINEKTSSANKVLVFFISSIMLFLAVSVISDLYPSDSKYAYIGHMKYILEPEYTKHGDFETMTKKDSLREKKNKYQYLYIVNGEKLRSDSIFVINRKLNDKKNEARKILELKKLDSTFKGKNSEFDNLQKHTKTVLIKIKDSIYFENNFSIPDKADTILYRLLKRNALIKNSVQHKLNDSISVSFVERSEGSSNVWNMLNLILSILLFLILAVVNFILIYKLYLLNKYKKIYTNETD